MRNDEREHQGNRLVFICLLLAEQAFNENDKQAMAKEMSKLVWLFASHAQLALADQKLKVEGSKEELRNERSESS